MHIPTNALEKEGGLRYTFMDISVFILNFICREWKL